jgi:hypothetical protein
LYCEKCGQNLNSPCTEFGYNGKYYIHDYKKAKYLDRKYGKIDCPFECGEKISRNHYNSHKNFCQKYLKVHMYHDLEFHYPKLRFFDMIRYISNEFTMFKVVKINDMIEMINESYKYSSPKGLNILHICMHKKHKRLCSLIYSLYPHLNEYQNNLGETPNF